LNWTWNPQRSDTSDLNPPRRAGFGVQLVGQ
jgi:hypothetical protein